METWVGSVSSMGGVKIVEVQASNLTTALKRVVEGACPEYGEYGPPGDNLPPGGATLGIQIRRVAKEK